MAVYHVTKGIAAFSFLLGFILLLVSIWTFSSIVYREYHENVTITETENTSGTTPLIQTTETFPVAKTTNSHNRRTRRSVENSEEIEFFAKYDPSLTKFFKGLSVGCSWVALIGALFQIASSLIIVFSSSRKITSRSKYFVGFHFLTFVILLATLFTPLAYDRENDTFYSMTSFNTKTKQAMEQLQREEFWKFLISDLHAYYAVLMIDCACIFLIVTVVSCLLRCSATTTKLDFYDRYK